MTGLGGGDGGRWPSRVAAAERLTALLEKGGLPSGRVSADDVLPVVCATPAHPVVDELVKGWGVEGLVERLVVCCRAVPAIQRGELRPRRLARRLEDALRESTRDRHLVTNSPGLDRLAARSEAVSPPEPVVEWFVADRVDTLEEVVGRPLPRDDRAVVEDLLHSTVDFAASIAVRLQPDEAVWDLLTQPSARTTRSRRLLLHLRHYWPEVPDPTVTALHRLVRCRLLDPSRTAGTVGATAVRQWRSWYPALHRPVALCIVRQQQQRDYEPFRQLRNRAMQGDWSALEAALAEPHSGLAA